MRIFRIDVQLPDDMFEAAPQIVQMQKHLTTIKDEFGESNVSHDFLHRTGKRRAPLTAVVETAPAETAEAAE